MSCLRSKAIWTRWKLYQRNIPFCWSNRWPEYSICITHPLRPHLCPYNGMKLAIKPKDKLCNAYIFYMPRQIDDIHREILRNDANNQYHQLFQYYMNYL